MNSQYNKRTATISTKRSNISKADIFIYVLALVAFLLMIFVLIANRTQNLNSVTYLFSESNYRNLYRNEQMNIYENEKIESEIVRAFELNKNNVENEKVSSYNIDSKSTEINENEANRNNESFLTFIKDFEKELTYPTKKELDNNNKNEINEINIFKTTTDKTDKLEEREVASDKLVDKSIIEEKEQMIEQDIDNLKNEMIDNNTIEKIATDKEEREEETDKIVEGDKDTSTSEIIYRVKSGDALWKIALNNSISTKNLIEYNNLTNPDLIYPGQIIRIPVNM